MAQHNVSFPSYLTAKHCRDTSVDFLLGARNSLQKYHDEQLQTAHKGGMRNIRNFLEQRREWLKECDTYLQLTGQGRAFRDESTTSRIFSAMATVSEELNRLVNNGSRDIHASGQTELAEERFKQLFEVVDTHKTDLQLRGQLVIR